MSIPELVCIGSIIKPHGVRGELVVDPVGVTLGTLGVGDSVHVGSTETAVEILGLRPNKRRWLMVLAGISDRNAAEAVRGTSIFVLRDSLASLAAHEVRVDDIVGFAVHDAAGEVLGDVVGVLSSGGHDLMELKRGTEIVLVPMVRDWLVEFSSESRRIVLDVPEGLVSASVAASESD